MVNMKRYVRTLMMAFMALVPGLLLVGCRGNLGWDRMQTSLERSSHGEHVSAQPS